MTSGLYMTDSLTGA